MTRSKIHAFRFQSLRVILPVISCLVFASGCGEVKNESQTLSFTQNPILQESESTNLATVISELSSATGVPANKLSGYEVRYKVVGPFGARPSPPTDSIKFNGLTESEFNSLRSYLNQGHKAPNTLTPRPDGVLSDLLPPYMQALDGKRFVLQEFQQGPYLFTAAANCWTTTYELTRLRVSGGSDFHVFYTDDDLMDKAFEDESLFKTVATKKRTDLAALIAQTQPGDILNFFNPTFIHSVIVVAPGLVFEKQGPTSEAFYRLRTLEGALSDWPTAANIKIVRATNKALPHPLTFANAPMGGNIITYAQGTEFSVISALPPLIPGQTKGLWELPSDAFDAATFKAQDAPGRPLNLSGN